MRLRNTKESLKRVERPLNHFELANESIAKATNAEHEADYSEAYLHYCNAANVLEQAGRTKWTRSDFILLMSVYNHIFELIEDNLLKYRVLPGHTERQHQEKVRNENKYKLMKFSASVERLYKISPNIKVEDFCLTAVRAALSASGDLWYDVVEKNDAIPKMLPERIEAVAVLLQNSLPKVDHAALTELQDERIYLASHCYIALAAAYLRLADVEQATNYIILAINFALTAHEKDMRYFDILAVGFNHINTHNDYHEDFALIDFARRLFHQPVMGSATFSEFNSAFNKIAYKKDIAYPNSVRLSKLLFEVLQERMLAGAFTYADKDRFHSEFPDSEFRIAMAQPYYQQRFARMREILLLPPPLLMAPAREREVAMSASANGITGIMMNSRLFSPTLRREASSIGLFDLQSDDSDATPIKDEGAKRAKI